MRSSCKRRPRPRQRKKDSGDDPDGGEAKISTFVGLPRLGRRQEPRTMEIGQGTLDPPARKVGPARKGVHGDASHATPAPGCAHTKRDQVHEIEERLRDADERLTFLRSSDHQVLETGEGCGIHPRPLASLGDEEQDFGASFLREFKIGVRWIVSAAVTAVGRHGCPLGRPQKLLAGTCRGAGARVKFSSSLAPFRVAVISGRSRFAERSGLSLF